MVMSPRVQILDEAACIYHCANTLWESTHPTILSPVIVKIVRKTGSFKPVKPRLKIDLVPHLARAKGWVYTNRIDRVILIYENVIKIIFIFLLKIFIQNHFIFTSENYHSTVYYYTQMTFSLLGGLNSPGMQLLYLSPVDSSSVSSLCLLGL